MVPQLPDRCSKNRENSHGTLFGRSNLCRRRLSVLCQLGSRARFFQGFPAPPFDFMPNRNKKRM
jgi:hypothetical protein